MIKIYNQNNFIRHLLMITILLLMVVMLLGCAGNYGHIQRSREAGRSFENFQVQPDHIYYYSGPDAIPYAIIGIHKDYTLKTRLWKRVDLTSGLLEVWLDLGMQGTLGFPPYGSYIFSPDGQKIGIWYSIFRGTVVKMENDNIVIVHPPSSFPGQNVRPSIERGAIDSIEPLFGAINENSEKTSAYAVAAEQL
jgi:hypothetical protein